MSMTYTQFVQRLMATAVTTTQDTPFLDNLPNFIDLAEQRCYRELDLLSTVVRDTGGSCTANARNFTLPQTGGRFVVVNGINVVTPVGSTTSNGTRKRLTQASLDAMDMLWPSEAAASATTVPVNFAMVTDQTLVFGPPPGAAFQVEVIGTIRPTPLSPTNTTTYLTLYLPDLFFAAAMIAVAGWQRDFGAQTSDPTLSQSWEAQYKTFFASAFTEEERKRFASFGWTSMSPTPIAATPR